MFNTQRKQTQSADAPISSDYIYTKSHRPVFSMAYLKTRSIKWAHRARIQPGSVFFQIPPNKETKKKHSLILRIYVPAISICRNPHMIVRWHLEAHGFTIKSKKRKKKFLSPPFNADVTQLNQQSTRRPRTQNRTEYLLLVGCEYVPSSGGKRKVTGETACGGHRRINYKMKIVTHQVNVITFSGVLKMFDCDVIMTVDYTRSNHAVIIARSWMTWIKVGIWYRNRLADHYKVLAEVVCCLPVYVRASVIGIQGADYEVPWGLNHSHQRNVTLGTRKSKITTSIERFYKIQKKKQINLIHFALSYLEKRS